MSGDTQYTGPEWEDTDFEPADEDGTPLGCYSEEDCDEGW